METKINSGCDYNRPRRPNPDTLIYLQSLSLNERQSHAEIKDYIKYKKTLQNGDSNVDDVEEAEYPQGLMAAEAALDEILNEVASLAGDEFGSQCLETIVRILVPYSSLAARKLLYGITGYMVHLSTHRYGSHVVQTILQFASQPTNIDDVMNEDICRFLKLTEEKTQDNLNHEIPPMKDLLCSISGELLSVTKDLAVHVCGSHVLRSLICVLGGVEEILPLHLAMRSSSLNGYSGSRRGKMKTKKKKKKRNNSNESENTSNTDGDVCINNASYNILKRIEKPRFDVKDKDILDCFYMFYRELSGVDLIDTNCEVYQMSHPGDLQELACNPSAGPLLIVLLKVLTARTSIRTVEEKVKGANEEKADFKLGIPHPDHQFESGSQAEVLAKTFLSWDDKDKSGNDQKYAGDIIFGMSGERRGSHLLETLLKMANDEFYTAICVAGSFFESVSIKEYVKHDVSNYVVQTILHTVRNREQAESMVRILQDLVGEGYILDPKNKRQGIFWRLVEMCAKFRVGQETVLKSMRKGFMRLNNSIDEIDKSSENNYTGNFEIKECISRLIRYKPPQKTGGKISLDVSGARATYHLLKFVPRLSAEVLKGINTSFTAEDMLELCKDGLGSRCIIDGILEGSVDFSREILNKLKGQWVSLSVERVGHHIVRKLFARLPSMDDKMILSAELANGLNRLNGNAMGRCVIVECAVKDFLEGKEVWREAVKKQMKTVGFLNAIIDDKLSKGGKKRKRRSKNSVSKDSRVDHKKNRNDHQSK